MDAVADILFRVCAVILFLGAIIGVLVGTGLLLKPHMIDAINRKYSRWVGTEKFEDHLSRPRWIERALYRHHRILGGVLFFGAIFVLYRFLFSYNVRAISAVIAPKIWGVGDAVVAVLLIGSVVAALVGLIVLLRPSLLRDIEKSSNRWINTERKLPILNTMHHFLDEKILHKRKTVGTILLIASLYVLLILGNFLFFGSWKL